MCLAVPVRVTALFDDQWVDIEVGGIRTRVSIGLIDDVKVGDYVIVHVGFALSRVDEDEAKKVFEYLKQIEELGELKEAGS